MTPETPSEKRVFFYHQQRILWPFLVGFVAFILWHNGLMPGDNAAIPAFIAYVVVGLSYDWLLFNYLGYKDSKKLNPEEWQQHNVTPEQGDKLNEFYIMVRRCAVASGIAAATLCALFFPQASIMGTFFFAYAGITIMFVSIGIFTKEIVFKYTAANVLATPEKNKSPFSQVAADPTSDNPSLNPLWFHYTKH